MMIIRKFYPPEISRHTIWHHKIAQTLLVFSVYTGYALYHTVHNEG